MLHPVHRKHVKAKQAAPPRKRKRRPPKRKVAPKAKRRLPAAARAPARPIFRPVRASPVGGAVIVSPGSIPSGAPAPSAEQALPAPQVSPQPDPVPRTGGSPSPAPVTTDLSPRQAERLLWRAGFGPVPGDVERLVSLGLQRAVDSLLDPGEEHLTGPEPRDEHGNPLAPKEVWLHDHLWWLDRMVRTRRPLVERMTLIWHDWFATSKEKVGRADLMLDQNTTQRRLALGSFRELLSAMGTDPAMLVWLDGVGNQRFNANENYAREVMELFTLGAERGAYTEQDVRELSRAFTGRTCDWVDGVGYANFREVPGWRDSGPKTVFGKTGDFGYEEAHRLLLEHPLHASFFVTKLWSYFVPTPPDAATQAALQESYVASGYEVRPVLRRILTHPDLLDGPAMVKPPVVYCAGLLRALGRGVDTAAWPWLCFGAGQLLFFPPNVAGWADDRWLDASTWRWRWNMAAVAIDPRKIDPWSTTDPYPADEDARLAVDRALAFAGNPVTSADVRDTLEDYANAAIPAGAPPWSQGVYRALRQNALRLLVLTSSDAQTS